MKILHLSVAVSLSLLLVGCGGSQMGGGSNVASSPPPLTGVYLYALSAPSIPVSGSVALTATGAYGGPSGTSKDVTYTATWTSSNDAIATVTMGKVTGTGDGSVTVTAKLESYSDVTTVVVGLVPNIVVTPDGAGTFNLSQPKRQFFANATYSDSTVLDLTNYVTWSASPTGVMKFDDPYGLQPGLATFTSTGTATITATLKEGEEGSLTVTVDP